MTRRVPFLLAAIALFVVLIWYPPQQHAVSPSPPIATPTPTPTPPVQSPSRNDYSAPERLVRSLLTCLQELKDHPAGEPEQAVRALLHNTMDSSTMMDRILGKGAQSLEAATRRRFDAAMGAVVEHTVAKMMMKIETPRTALFDVKFAPESDRAIVSLTFSSTTPDDGPRSIDFRLKRTIGSDEWRIYDIIFENIGIISNYRSEISSLMKSLGTNGTIERIESSARARGDSSPPDSAVR